MAATGRGHAYRKARARLLASGPVCVWCRERPATTADHVPALAEAPSNLAIIGRYVLTPEVFDALARTRQDDGAQAVLGDALKKTRQGAVQRRALQMVEAVFHHGRRHHPS